MTRTPHDADTPSTPAPRAAAPTSPVEPAPEFVAVKSEKERAKAEKAIRLASALRVNLRRRKAPARTPGAPRDTN
jgi:hypothetical protein